jgi:hypothetical protein
MPQEPLYTPPIDASEKKIIADFLGTDFPGLDLDANPKLGADEQRIVERVEDYVAARFKGMKYILGLALDFTLLAQRLSTVDEEGKAPRKGLTEESLFARYQLVTERGTRQANTLTLKYGGMQQGIRKIEESVAEFFHRLKRTDYPSAYVYNTGQWQKYKDLLVDCFRLSEDGRFELCRRLIHFGLANMAVADFYGRSVPRPAMLPEIISSYPRAARGENGGLTLQALAYGFCEADRPHLSIVTDKVRRGSKRQKQIGDIDCYSGIDLELSVEVKDFEITSENLEAELGDFMQSVASNRIKGLVIAASATDDGRRELSDRGLYLITLKDLSNLTAVWDWPKQNAVVLGMLHFLSHVEQNPDAVERLLAFISERDPRHDSLTYYRGGTAS